MEKDYFSHLSQEERRILKNKGTEAAFSGEYNDFFQAGIFVCRACENPLYQSNTKFNSGCGWPSFDEGMKGSIKKYKDLSGGRIRTEICCKKCDGHLGHVFEGEQITAKKRRPKRGIKSKVKQMGRFSEDSGPDPAPKRAKGPAGIIREEEARVERTGRTGSPMPKRQNIASGPGPFGAGQFSRRSRQMQQRTFYRGRSGRSSSDTD